jgi:hypothetical protein
MGLIVVAFGVPFVAPRVPFLVEEKIPSTRVRGSFVGFSVAATLFGLAAPLIFYRGVGWEALIPELFFAGGVVPLTVFSAVQRRPGGALSATGRGIAYGCAVLIATLLGGEFVSITVAVVGGIMFHLSTEAFLAALVMCQVLRVAGLAMALIYCTSRRRPAWHALAPLVALHVSWIMTAALMVPVAFSEVMFFGQPYSRAPGSLLLASAAASIAAIVSARPTAVRGIGTRAVLAE